MKNIPKGGKRADLNNMYFRSTWEANFARYLNYFKIQWEYEPKTFFFKGIKKGTMFYTPDFYLPTQDKWIEIKGWFTPKSKTKLKRFKIYYPNYFRKLQVVIYSKPFRGNKNLSFLISKLKLPYSRIISYLEIKNKVGGLINNWE